MISSFLKFCVICSAIYIFVHPNIAQSESVNIAGVSFKVDEIVRVDTDLLKVVLLGETRVINKNDLSTYILRRYLADTTTLNSIDPLNLIKIIKNALTNSDIETSFDALLGLMNHPKFEHGDLLKVLEEISKIKRGQELLQRVVLFSQSDIPSPDLGAAIIFYAGIKDPEWIRSTRAEFATRFEQPLSLLGERRFIRAAVGEEYEELSSIIKFFEVYLGTLDDRYLKFANIYALLIKARSDAEKGDIESILALSVEEADRKIFKEAVSPILLKALHKRAAQSIAENKFGDALQVLTRVSVDKRTPTTHELVNKAVLGISPLDPVLNDMQVELMLGVFAQNDPNIMAVYLSSLEKAIQASLDSKNMNKALEITQKLFVLRPDPNEANDEIRLLIAGTLISMGDRTAAKGMIKAMQNPPSFFEYSFLILRGLYIHPFIMLILGSIPLSVVYIFLRKNRPKTKEVQELESNGGEQNQTEPADIFQDRVEEGESKFTPKSAVNLPPDFNTNEYVYYLGLFGLKPGVDMRAIKAAYRNAVKEYHPDLNTTPGIEASDRFIELTQAYDRLVELEKKRTGG